jgi:hypothetical protein
MKEDIITKVKNDVAFEQKHKDGFSQIMIGLFMVIIALFLYIGIDSYAVFILILFPGLIESLRKRITYPRIGYAKLEDNRKVSSGVWAFIVALIIAVGVVIFVIETSNSSLEQAAAQYRILMGVFAMLIIGFLGYASIKYKSKAVMVYGGFAIVFITVTLIFKVDQSFVTWFLFGFGVLNLVYGIYALIKFLKAYPVLKDAE